MIWIELISSRVSIRVATNLKLLVVFFEERKPSFDRLPNLRDTCLLPVVLENGHCGELEHGIWWPLVRVLGILKRVQMDGHRRGKQSQEFLPAQPHLHAVRVEPWHTGLVYMASSGDT